MQSKLVNKKKAIIIGSGIAGLATAIRLAVQGFEVDVFEKNSYPGGKLSDFKKDEYHFDAGPSLFTEPQNIEELFTLADEPIENYFSYQPVEIACKYFYENGKVINAHTNRDLFAQELNEKLNENKQNISRYLSDAQKLYNNIGTVFTDHSLHKRKTWLHKRALKALLSVKYPYLFNTLDKHNKSKFSTKEAVQLFNRYATYNGSSPYKAPGMLSLIPHLEFTGGTFYPLGGMISITNALFHLAEKKGVRFFFNAPVKNIIHHEGHIKGVVVNDQNIYADIVVSNMDVYFTYTSLLQNQHMARQVLKQERSSSALVFYWGIKKQFPDLELHNIFFSKNYREEFNCLFKKKELYHDPTVYINITSKMETGLAPDGKENWFVMINAPAINGQDWEKIKKQAKKSIIEKLNGILSSVGGVQTDIESLIETEEILEPITIEERTNSFKGSIYGTSSNSKLAAFFRHPNFSRTIKGLYFCGGSVHPGGGIPLCLKSAKIVSELIASSAK